MPDETLGKESRVSGPRADVAECGATETVRLTRESPHAKKCLMLPFY